VCGVSVVSVFSGGKQRDLPNSDRIADSPTGKYFVVVFYYPTIEVCVVVVGLRVHWHLLAFFFLIAMFNFYFMGLSARYLEGFATLNIIEAPKVFAHFPQNNVLIFPVKWDAALKEEREKSVVVDSYFG
jgi:hypothetical protein